MTGEQPAAGQIWSARDYADNARFVADLGDAVLGLLDPRPGERVLDLGCGDGALTRRIAEHGATVVGLEPDPDLSDRAAKSGIATVRADAHDLPFAGSFDAVFSNAALHWMRQPVAVFRNVAVALKPGGRFVAEQGGFGNVAAICVALAASLERSGHPDRAALPWDFPTPAQQARRLADAGFLVDRMALLPRPTPLPTGMRGWLKTFAGPFIAGLADREAEAILNETERRLEPVLKDSAGRWSADYVRLRFRATFPASGDATSAG